MRTYIHVEEPSMKTALDGILPKLIADNLADVTIIDHGSKSKLLQDLPNRLRGYAIRLQHEDIRALVLIDRDDDDCRVLKTKLEEMAAAHGLITKSTSGADGAFRVVNRIVVEELEAWFFGDIPALRLAYPKIPPSLARKSALRDPDAIVGGTHERLLRTLQSAGYYKTATRLPKTEVARNVAVQMNPTTNKSHSFNQFTSALHALLNVA